MASKRGKHQSIPKELKPLAARLEGNPLVKKMILGFSENARHSFAPGKAKLQFITDAGFKLKTYSGNGVTEVFVVCDLINIPPILENIKEFLVCQS